MKIFGNSQWYQGSDKNSEVKSDGTVVGTMTQNLVTGSRANNVTYQNTTGKIMYVSIVTNGTTANTSNAKCDAGSPPTTTVASQSGQNLWDRHIFFIVLPNFYYRVSYDGTAPTILLWVEWY